MTSVAELVEVRLLGLPVALSRRAQEHFADLHRELVLLPGSAVRSALPTRLLDLVDRTALPYGVFSGAEEQRSAAAGRGALGDVDLALRVRPSAGQAAGELMALLDEADALCRSGHLLTVAAPDDCRAYRRWYLGQVADQVRGAAPVSWSDWAARRA